MENRPIIKKEQVETVYDSRFIKVFDLQYEPGKHYFDATRRVKDNLAAVKSDEALEGLPVLMDGFISGVAALCAVRLCPAAEKAVFASHCSTEPAARLVLEALGKAPLLTAGLHLGEGTGAVASIPLWDMALAVYRDCYSFTEGGITPYTPQC